MITAAELAQQLPDAQLRADGPAIQGVVRSGDGYFAVRVRSAPFAEIFVATRPLDGFELRIAWGDRWRDPALGEPAFDERFGLATNDEALMRAWLDATSRQALLDSIYTYQLYDVGMHETLTGIAPDHPLWRPPPTAQRTWTYALAGDELVATKGTAEGAPDRLALAVRTACALAGRAHRWAAEYAELAAAIGGTAPSEVAIGGAPVITTVRHAVDITVSLLRRLPGDREGRLRTRVTAARTSHTRDTLSLVHDGYPRGARPPLHGGPKQDLELPGYTLRATGELAAALTSASARGLVATALPGVGAIDDDSADLWFDGALADRARLDAAVELAARWATGSIAPHGPYR